MIFTVYDTQFLVVDTSDGADVLVAEQLSDAGHVGHLGCTIVAPPGGPLDGANVWNRANTRECNNRVALRLTASCLS